MGSERDSHSLDQEIDLGSVTSENSLGSEYEPNPNSVTPHFVTRADFEDLVRDINLSNRSAEILGSRLQQWGLVSSDFLVTSTRKHSNNLSFNECFVLDEKSGITYVKEIQQIFHLIVLIYNPQTTQNLSLFGHFIVKRFHFFKFYAHNTPILDFSLSKLNFFTSKL